MQAPRRADDRPLRRRPRRVQQRRRGRAVRSVVRPDQLVGVGDGRQLLGRRPRLPGVPPPPRCGGGHIVNTASIAGLFPGFGPSYDASKHAVVAITEQLYNTVQAAGLPIGVSVLCPGWVRTNILEADRNWPAELGAKPDDDPADDGHPPARRAGPRRGPHAGVGGRRRRSTPSPPTASGSSRTRTSSTSRIERWATIAERADPQPPEDVPGMPPRSQILAEVAAALGLDVPAAPTSP